MTCTYASERRFGQQQRARPSLCIQATWPGTLLLVAQLNISILLSQKLRMEPSKLLARQAHHKDSALNCMKHSESNSRKQTLLKCLNMCYQNLKRKMSYCYGQNGLNIIYIQKYTNMNKYTYTQLVNTIQDQILQKKALSINHLDTCKSRPTYLS